MNQEKKILKNAVPGVEFHRDLWNAGAAELRRLGCRGCKGRNVLRKYRRLVADRQKLDMSRRRG
jgi:hypothetical protein